MTGDAHPTQRNRLRTWGALAAAAVVLLLACGLGVWSWVRSDVDVVAIEHEAVAAGLLLQSEPTPSGDPVRQAEARRIAALATTRLRTANWPNFAVHQGKPLDDEFRAAHAQVPIDEAMALPSAVIALGDAPLWWSGNERWDYQSKTSRWLNQRLLVADGDELALCLRAVQAWYGQQFSRPSEDFTRVWALREFCQHAIYRLSDQRERLRESADWLEARAVELLEEYPDIVTTSLIGDFTRARDPSGLVRHRGHPLPDWLHVDPVLAVVNRKERGDILRRELSWFRFVQQHPGQPRVWMDESNRRQALHATDHSWFGTDLHLWLPYCEHPQMVVHLLRSHLSARLLAAELRGDDWPVDVLDPAQARLRPWHKHGRLIGAYSVGRNGTDDAGRVDDITIRLYLELPEPQPAP